MTERTVRAMTPRPQKTPGRPRGSGRSPDTIDLDLTAEEATPFRAGRRIGTADPDLALMWSGDLAQISPRLMPHERQALATADDSQFIHWVAIGMLAGLLHHYVRTVRGV